MGGTRGFTLVELLLVLAIIGILSAIAVPALLGQRDRAKANAVKEGVLAVIPDLVNTIEELTSHPSERKAGFPTTTYDSTPTSLHLKAEDAIRIVLATGNLGQARNPYQNGGVYQMGAPSASAGNLGKVFLDPASASIAGAPFLTVTGIYRSPKGDIASLQKQVPVD